jgi:hypothetical protein
MFYIALIIDGSSEYAHLHYFFRTNHDVSETESVFILRRNLIIFVHCISWCPQYFHQGTGTNPVYTLRAQLWLSIRVNSFLLCFHVADVVWVADVLVVPATTILRHEVGRVVVWSIRSSRHLKRSRSLIILIMGGACSTNGGEEECI